MAGSTTDATPPSQRQRQRRRRRRWLALVPLLLALLVLVVSPVWTPWLVRPLAARFGLTVAGIERVGYWRLRLNGVAFSSATVGARCQRIELLQPGGWLVERLLPGRLATETRPSLAVEGWEVIMPTNAPPVASTKTPAQVLSQARTMLDRVRPWLQHARLGAGVVRLGTNDWQVAPVLWANGRLGTSASAGPQWGTVQVALDTAVDNGAFEATARHPAAKARLTATPAAKGAWDLSLELTADRAELHGAARLAPEEPLPTTADLAAKLVAWPAWLGEQPRGLSQVRLALTANWTNHAAQVRLDGQARVAAGSLPDRTVNVALSARANEDELRLEQADVLAPGLSLRLAEPITAPWRRSAAPPEGRFAIAADLGQLGLPETVGTLGGKVHLHGGVWNAMQVSGELSGTNVAWRDTPLPRCGLAGSLRWPEFTLTKLELGDDTGELTVTGRVDLAEARIEALEWDLDGLPRLLAARLGEGRASGHGRITGPLAQPKHSGRLALANVRLPACRPLQASLDWSGDGWQTEWQAGLSAAKEELRAAGRLTVNVVPPASARLETESLTLAHASEVRMRLAEPTAVQATLRPEGIDLALAPIRLTGDGRRLDLAADLLWPRRGRASCQVAGLQARDFAGWLVRSLPDATLEHLSAEADWNEGPARLALDARAVLATSTPGALTGELQLRTDAGGTRIEQAVLRRAGKPLLRAEGRAPLVWQPARSAAPRLAADQPFLLTATAGANSDLWAELTRRLGLQVTQPKLELVWESAGAQPRGQLRFHALEARSLNTFEGFEPPAIEQPEVTVTLGPDPQLAMTAKATVLGQQGEASASLPLDLTQPAKWRQPDWDQLSACLRLPSWDGAALAALAPGLLRPRGRLDVDLVLSPSRRLQGRVKATGLATRPLPSLGVLRNIQVDVRLEEELVRLESARAELGGEPIKATGVWRPLPPRNAGPEADAKPGFDVTLGGTNLTLVRRPDVFLRGDLDLRIRGTNLTSGVVSGRVQMHNSLLMRDLQSLVTGSIEEPATRPPFFSVSTAPFRDWRLDLRVVGERFLRVLTPVFKGRVSAALQLTGTLGEPMALGDVTVPEGRIAFPFGALQVAQGRVSLSRAQPFRPQLNFQASALNFGYDVRMDISGAADTPLVVFSSVPPLTSTQILLMLTSGDIPSGTFSYSSRGRLQNIGLFLGKEFLGKLTGDSDNDRLSLRSGEEVTDRGQLTYTIEYRLSPRWSAFGAKDRFDSYAGGLKWRVYSK